MTRKLNPGDILRKRGLIPHEGVYVGKQGVIERAKPSNGAIVREIGVQEFLGNGRADVVEILDACTPDQIVRRAKSRLGEQGYDALRLNCQHFTHWCATGIEKSSAVETGRSVVKFGVFVLAAGAFLHAITEDRA